MAIERLTPVLISLAFWGIGVLAFFFGEERVKWIMGLFGVITCITITTGAVSAFTAQWVPILFGFLLWLCGPVIVQTHLILFNRPHNRWLIIILYSLGAILSILGLIGRNGRLGISVETKETINYAWFGLNLIVVILLTAEQFVRRSSQKGPRRSVWVLTLISLTAFCTVLVVSLLPEMLFGRSLIPYELSFLTLVLIPIGYGLLALEHRLTAVSRYINRTIWIFFIALTVTGVYLVVYYAFWKIFQASDRPLLLSGLVVTLGLVALAKPLSRWTAVMGDILLFGETYDFQAAIQDIEKTLEVAGATPQSVSKGLCRSLQRIMRVDYAGLLLVRGDVFVFSGPRSAEKCSQWHFPEKEIRSTLDKDRPPLTQEELAAAIARTSPTGGESADTLAHLIRNAEILLPLQGGRGCLAIVFLGPRKGFRQYTNADMGILESITGQARTALEKTYLLAEAQELSSQAARLNRQVIQAREDERKRVARDLHDQVIQSLVGLNFQVAELRNGQGREATAKINLIQEMIRGLSQDLRRICAELRPPALDTVGLIPTLESRISELKQQSEYSLSFTVEGDDTQDLPDDVSLCLFRVFQESILNIQKHSQARQVEVVLRVDPKAVSLTVRDNGRGFIVPAQIDELVKEYHFGLVGLREMVEAAGGQLSLASEPGCGSAVRATIPLGPTDAEITTEKTIGVQL